MEIFRKFSRIYLPEYFSLQSIIFKKKKKLGLVNKGSIRQ